LGWGAVEKRKLQRGALLSKGLGTTAIECHPHKLHTILVPFIQNGEKNKSKLFMSHN